MTGSYKAIHMKVQIGRHFEPDSHAADQSLHKEPLSIRQFFLATGKISTGGLLLCKRKCLRTSNTRQPFSSCPTAQHTPPRQIALEELTTHSTSFGLTSSTSSSPWARQIAPSAALASPSWAAQSCSSSAALLSSFLPLLRTAPGTCW